MKKLCNYFPLIMILGALLMVSCKKDDMENIVLKQTGNFKATFLNGTEPVKDTKVRLYNVDHGGLIEILTTDEVGVINLQNFIEGNYAFSMEINEPHYVEVYQQFQVLSGNSEEKSIQVKDHSGSLSVFFMDSNTATIIKEDLEAGVAIVPNNSALKKALTNKDILALATEIKFFGNTGKVDFTNVPSGYYNLYRVNAAADTIITHWKVNSYVRNNENSIESFSINFLQEVIFSRPKFSVSDFTAVDVDRNAITESPFSSIKFYKEDGSTKIEFKMPNDVTFTGVLYLQNNGSYSVSSFESSDEHFLFNMYPVWLDRLSFVNGKLVLKVDRISIIDFSGEDPETKNYYDVHITMDKDAVPI